MASVTQTLRFTITACFSTSPPSTTAPWECRNGRFDAYFCSVRRGSHLALTLAPFSPNSGIPPGEVFTYIVDTERNAQHGTFWYHSHYGGQYVDGLRAPLIIHNNPEVHAYDEEFTVMLYDW